MTRLWPGALIFGLLATALAWLVYAWFIAVPLPILYVRYLDRQTRI